MVLNEDKVASLTSKLLRAIKSKEDYEIGLVNLKELTKC